MDFRTLEEIAEAIRACTRCPLHATRTQPVPGEGGYRRPIILVGEAPGREEDKQGRPFVGPAGKLLDELLSLAGLTREDVFITNILKCRPPNNRDPLPKEIQACSPYLEAQFRILRPKLVITLGRFAWGWFAEHLGIPYEKISKVHGRLFCSNTIIYGKIFLIPMYHPATALYRPPLRAILEEDFRKLREHLERIGV